MLSDNMEKALNKQINKELYSSYLYFAMAADLEDKGYAGTAHWMESQAQEEISHAMRIYNFINERGGRAVLEAIDKPKKEWSSIKEIFEDSLEHEQKITASINALMDIAIEENDYATKSFLNWFVDEQVEEEDTVNEILDKINLIEDSKNGMYNLDKELGQRPLMCEFVSEDED